MTEELFAFCITREFLAADDSTEESYVSDRFAVLVGAFLFAVIVLVGLITYGNA